MSVALVLVVVVSLALASCARPERVDSVELDPTSVVHVRPSWAVISVEYARVHESADRSSSIVGHYRRRSVVRIVSVGTDTTASGGVGRRWYLVSGEGVTGWVFGSELDTHTTETRARGAGAAMNGDE